MSLRPRFHAAVTALALAGLGASVVSPAAAAEPPARARSVRPVPAAPTLVDVPLGNALPVPAPHRVRFSDDWHACRDGCARQHKGTDVFADEGTPLVAVESGLIAKVDNTDDGNGGLSVWLLGESGVAYYYAHNSANYVAAGQRVGRGQMLGRVGRTGNAATTPAHVHFQVNRCGLLDSGEPCTENPFPHLSRWAPGELSGGADALGLYRRSTAGAELRIEGGSALAPFGYGTPPENGAQVVAGDWNGDGRDTIGLYRTADATFALRDEAGSVLPPVVLGTPGQPGVVPVAGDWNGDGRDTVGIYRIADGAFVRLDETGAVLPTLTYGWPGASDTVPVVGDWDGDGRDAVGLYRTRDGVFRLRDEIGTALGPLPFGTAGGAELPVVGDWNGDGRDAVGVYQRTSSTFVLGGPDPAAPGTGATTFVTGDQPAPDLLPLVGDWNGLDLVTLEDLRTIFGVLDEPAVAAQLPALNEAMLRAGAVTPARKAAFLTTLRHESGFRADAVEVGNASPYRGRGFIQLTGVFNYRSASQDLGVDLVTTPDLAAQGPASALVAAWYWTVARDINYAADRLDMAAVNIAVGFRPTVREDMQRCADFVRALKWFSGGLLPEGVNCARTAEARATARATLAPAARSRASTASIPRLPTVTTAPRAVPLPSLDATLPPEIPLPDGGDIVIPPTPGILPPPPTSPTTRPPTTTPPSGGPPTTDNPPLPTPTDPGPGPTTTTAPPDTTTTTVPDTTTTTNDLPPGWTDPGGGGVLP